ncbi:hypothetical protein OMK64_03255 [Cellulomonas fimi]|uniref:hypothetical protein n=1 Tax=Cellulomonas fimi TaxID=1708 RepID=UPI00234D9841|nr:hypothetical protein [Cellulomonas fimi]MDC7120547.1 hypothetical protein [Cellulomonas fimi]
MTEQQPTGPLKASQSSRLEAAGDLARDQLEKLRSDDSTAQREVLLSVRAQHVQERLLPARQAGLISEEEATELVRRVESGDHDPALRHYINELARRARKGEDTTTA